MAIRGKEMLFTELGAIKHRRVSGDVRFTRYGQELLTKLARNFRP